MMNTSEKPIDYSWPDAFWCDFINNHWENEPYSFTCPSQPFINLQELFHVVINMTNRGRSDRFWIAKNLPLKRYKDFVFASLDLLGPKSSDNDFNGFFKRMSNQVIGINIHALAKVMPELGKRIKPFITHLNQLEDHPTPNKWQTDTFFGNYLTTPFGIHRDNASVFAFALQGQRTYYTWKADYFQLGDKDLQNPDLDILNKHKDHGECFTIKPGEVFYWPSNRWHIATSNGEPSVVAQVSAYFKPADIGF